MATKKSAKPTKATTKTARKTKATKAPTGKLSQLAAAELVLADAGVGRRWRAAELQGDG